MVDFCYWKGDGLVSERDCDEQKADVGYAQDRSWGLEDQLDMDKMVRERDLYEVIKPFTVWAMCMYY